MQCGEVGLRTQGPVGVASVSYEYWEDWSSNNTFTCPVSRDAIILWNVTNNLWFKMQFSNSAIIFILTFSIDLFALHGGDNCSTIVLYYCGLTAAKFKEVSSYNVLGSGMQIAARFQFILSNPHHCHNLTSWQIHVWFKYEKLNSWNVY